MGDSDCVESFSELIHTPRCVPKHLGFKFFGSDQVPEVHIMTEPVGRKLGTGSREFFGEVEEAERASHVAERNQRTPVPQVGQVPPPVFQPVLVLGSSLEELLLQFTADACGRW